jgi:hypothetical protein
MPTARSPFHPVSYIKVIYSFTQRADSQKSLPPVSYIKVIFLHPACYIKVIFLG